MTKTVSHPRKHGIHALVTAFCLWIAMMVCLEIGRRIGAYELRVVGEGARAGIGVIDGAVFGLLSLLIGFSFNGAAGRFDKRRELVAEEVNAIGTAWQRIDLLAPAQQSALRPIFLRYFDQLIESYAHSYGPIDPLRETPEIAATGATLWTETIAMCLTAEGEKARVLLIPSLNEMLGAVERERLARRIHPPNLIVVMLVVTALAGALFGGYGMSNASTRNWLYIVGVTLTVSVAVYVILELEYPRMGLVRIDSMDQALDDLRRSMGPAQL